MKGLMTAEELDKRFDGENGLELEIENYKRMLNTWDKLTCKDIFYSSHMSICGLCVQYSYRSGICGLKCKHTCPLFQMSQKCNELRSIYQNMARYVDDDDDMDKAEAKPYAEEILRYMLQCKMYEDGEI